ncbi:MAG: hypothetical protein ACP5J1_02100 [Fervidicoccaceae archaeon]
MSERIAHMLSKDGRRKIIEVLVSERGEGGASEALGVSKAALSKFLRGKTHPSDVLTARAIEIAEGEEREKIIMIIAEDLASFARDFAFLVRNFEKKSKGEELLRIALKQLEESCGELRKSIEMR